MLAIYARTSKEDTESSIEQQIKAGTAFAVQNGMEFEVYTDEGKSGYKIADDDKNLFKDRPAFKQLLQDVQDKKRENKIDAIWVWELSRLSRNQFASGLIFRIFDKDNIKVYVLDKLYDSKDRTAKLTRSILDIMAEYERELIVARTTRGKHNSINEGTRSFGQLYGYKKIGRDASTGGHQILETVESEIENLKYAYKRILEGATLRQTALDVFKEKSDDKKVRLRFSQKLSKLLFHFSYTGYSLNIAGLEIYKKFRKNEFEGNGLHSLSALLEKDENGKPKYYVKSAIYTEKIIPVKDWIKAAERLQINSRMRKDYNIKKASKDMATGLITCSECGQKYYSYTHGSKRYGHEYEYTYYKHFAKMFENKCGQKKSFVTGNINEMFKIFFFLNYIVFDNTQTTHEETLRLIKIEQAKTEEKIKNLESGIKQSERNIKKFNRALDDAGDSGAVVVLAKRISAEEEKMKTAYMELTKSKIESENLKIRYSGTQLENMYENVKDKVKTFFKTKNTEEQRDLLIKSMRKCLVKGGFLFIDTGYNLYIFDTEVKYKFEERMLKNLEDDKYYRFNYTELDEKWKGADKETLKEIDETLSEVEFSFKGFYVMYLDYQPAILKKLKENKIKYDTSQFGAAVFVEKE